jgi:hypothetical protein
MMGTYPPYTPPSTNATHVPQNPQQQVTTTTTTHPNALKSGGGSNSSGNLLGNPHHYNPNPNLQSSPVQYHQQHPNASQPIHLVNQIQQNAPHQVLTPQISSGNLQTNSKPSAPILSAGADGRFVSSTR